MDQSTENAAAGGSEESPKKGPTLSTSTSSFEALVHDPKLSRLATTMFHRANDYITEELISLSLEDYKLLEEMNRVTITKYTDMNQIAENLGESSMELKQKLDDLV